jgi:peroxin-6
VNCYDLVCENEIKNEAILRARIEKAVECSPCILLLRHVEALGRSTQALESGLGMCLNSKPSRTLNSVLEPAIVGGLRDCLDDLPKMWQQTGFPVAVIGTTSERDRVSPAIMSCFKHEISLEASLLIHLGPPKPTMWSRLQTKLKG